MRWPQIVFICLLSIHAFVALTKHGQPRDEDYNVFASALAIALEVFILYSGGFFS